MSDFDIVYNLYLKQLLVIKQ